MESNEKTLGQVFHESYIHHPDAAPGNEREWNKIPERYKRATDFAAQAVIAEADRRHPEKAMAGELEAVLREAEAGLEVACGRNPITTGFIPSEHKALQDVRATLSRLDAARKGQPVPQSEADIERARTAQYRQENTELHRTIRQLEEENSLLRAAAGKLKGRVKDLDEAIRKAQPALRMGGDLAANTETTDSRYKDATSILPRIEEAEAIADRIISRMDDERFVLQKQLAAAESPAAEAQELNPL